MPITISGAEPTLAPRAQREAQGEREGLPACDLDLVSLLEAGPDAYLVLAADPPRYTVVAASDVGPRIPLARHEGSVGHGLFEVPPDDPADPAATEMFDLVASLDEVMRTREPNRMPMQACEARTPAGIVEERFLEPLNSPVFDERGRLAWIIHRVSDVTERVLSRRQADEAALQLTAETAAHALETQSLREVESVLERLRESEERYRLLADMIPQHIWTSDASGSLTFFSRRWYEFAGATPETSRGDGWLAWLHPDDRERTLGRWQRSLRTGEPYSIEYRFRDAAGDYCWFLGQAAPRQDETGRITGWFGTLTDISERRRLDEEREQLLEAERAARAEAQARREELERVSESRTRLMRGFSHDLKNPLGAADGYAALLEEGIGGTLTDMQRRSVQRIRHSLKVSLRLIHDLLELARAEAGLIELRVRPVDVAKLACDVADDFRGQADAAGLVLDVESPAPVPAMSDPTRVRQVLSNLVSNAVKYTSAGRVALTVRSLAGEGAPGSGEWVAIGVEDTGPGIPADKCETIFQEFTRLDPNALHGAGVGLAISRRIARLLGGDVTVESERGRGSTFTLWLPRERDAAAGVAAGAD